jgi:hypothetical protein
MGSYSSYTTELMILMLRTSSLQGNQFFGYSPSGCCPKATA